MKRAPAFWIVIALYGANVHLFTFGSGARAPAERPAAVSSQNGNNKGMPPMANGSENGNNNMGIPPTRGDMPPMANGSQNGNNMGFPPRGDMPPMANGSQNGNNMAPVSQTRSNMPPMENARTAPPFTTRSDDMQTEFQTTTEAMSSTTSNPETTTMATTMAPASNYSSPQNSTLNSTTPPYVDMYGNNLPKIINGTQYMPDTTDENEAIRPVIPLNSGNDASSVTLLVRLPANHVPQQALQAIQQNQIENFGEGNANGFRDTESMSQVEAYPGYPAFVSPVQTQPAYMGSVPQVQQYSGYKAVVLPLEAYKVDWYNDSSDSDTSIQKPLDDFFY